MTRQLRPRHEWENPAPGLPASYREFPRTQATRNPETSIPEITISYNRILAALKISYLGLYRFHHPFWNERPKPGDGKCWCGVKLNSEYAVKFDFISFEEVLQKGLNVMDTTAFTLSQENQLPIVVFDMNKAGNLLKICQGETIGTVVTI